MSADTILDRLNKVRQTGANTWTACCPAHEDKSPSLSITEKDDGIVLLHCFAGCSVEDVLDSIGLTFDSLFPPRDVGYRKPARRPFPATDALRIIGREALVVCAGAVSVCDGKPLSAADRQRLVEAGSRIQGALNAAGVAYV